MQKTKEVKQKRVETMGKHNEGLMAQLSEQEKSMPRPDELNNAILARQATLSKTKEENVAMQKRDERMKADIELKMVYQIGKQG